MKSQDRLTGHRQEHEGEHLDTSSYNGKTVSIELRSLSDGKQTIQQILGERQASLYCDSRWVLIE